MRRFSVLLACLAIGALAESAVAQCATCCSPADQGCCAEPSCCQLAEDCCGACAQATCGCGTCQSSPDCCGAECASSQSCGCESCCGQSCCGKMKSKYESFGYFNCSCRGSYKFPVPPLYTYHWPGMYSQQYMTEYNSPWRFPTLERPEAIFEGWQVNASGE